MYGIGTGPSDYLWTSTSALLLSTKLFTKFLSNSTSHTTDATCAAYPGHAPGLRLRWESGVADAAYPLPF